MLQIHPSARIDPTARIDVAEGFIGAGAIVREYAAIEGRRVEIGRDCFIGRGATIGGGSCRDPEALLQAGDFLFVGPNAHINIGRPVRLGHEVAVGWDTRIFTHGAYLSAWEGFPVQWGGVTVGDRVWLASCWVNPGIAIGSDVFVQQRALVTRDLPSGCLAAGVPAVPKAVGAFPRKPTETEKLALFGRIFDETLTLAKAHRSWSAPTPGRFEIEGGAVFEVDDRRITGPADAFTELLRNQLRRNGIRFRYEVRNGVYAPWQAE